MSFNNLDSFELGGLIPFTKEVLFVKATGTEEGVSVVGKAPMNHIGRYEINNGILGFVDENGDYWICPLPNANALRVLKEAGYKPGSVRVPHSNDKGNWIRGHFVTEQDSAS